MKLKPLQDLKASELDKVPNPINARFWIESARHSTDAYRGFTTSGNSAPKKSIRATIIGITRTSVSSAFSITSNAAV